MPVREYGERGLRPIGSVIFSVLLFLQFAIARLLLFKEF